MQPQLVNSKGQPATPAVEHQLRCCFLKPGESMTIKNDSDDAMFVAASDVIVQTTETRKSYDLVKTGGTPRTFAEGEYTPNGESKVTVRLDVYASKGVTTPARRATVSGF